MTENGWPASIFSARPSIGFMQDSACAMISGETPSDAAALAAASAFMTVNSPGNGTSNGRPLNVIATRPARSAYGFASSRLNGTTRSTGSARNFFPSSSSAFAMIVRGRLDERTKDHPMPSFAFL